MKVRALLPLALTATVYAVTAVLSHRLLSAGGGLSAVWPPSGVAIAAVLLGGPTHALAVLAGALGAALLSGHSAAQSSLVAAGEALEAMVAGGLIIRFVGGRPSLLRTRDILRYLAAVFLATTIGSAATLLPLSAHAVGGETMATTWRMRWLANALGAATIGPALLAWAAPQRSLTARQRWTATGILIVIAALTLVALTSPVRADADASLGTLLALLLLTWLALGFGVRAAATGAALMAVLAGLTATAGGGPLAEMPSPADQQLTLQLYLFTATLISLIVAATVAERDASLARLHVKSGQLALILDSSRDIVALFHRDDGSPFRIAALNRGVADRFFEGNVARAQLLLHGRSLLESAALLSYPPERRADVARAFDEVVDRRAAITIAGTVPTPIGMRTLDTTITPVASDAGTIDDIVVAARDVTEQLAAEQELRESEARLSLVYNAVTEPLTLWAVEASGEARLLSVNRAAIEMARRVTPDQDPSADLGASLVPLTRRRLESLGVSDAATVERLQALHVDALRQVAEERVPVRFIEEIRDESIWSVLEFTMIPVVRADGSISHLLRSARDVTEQRREELRRQQLETSLRQMQKMEAIGTLAGGVAHDFNNILAGILGNTELAREALPAAHPVHDFLDEVVTAVRRARDLVAQVLTFSRRQEGDSRLVQPAVVIDEASRLLRASLPATIRLTSDVAAVETVILADASQLHQVIMNLCTNAAYALHDRTGEIIISQRVVPYDDLPLPARDGLARGFYVSLSVKDNGCGMDQETLERIFEPFFTTKPLGEGTGLGLSVVHGIVRASRGAIGVVSTPGGGARFDVYLPVAERPADAPATAVAEIPRGQGEHVLFVDDERAIVTVARRILGQLGYRVTAFDSAPQALEAFRAEPAAFDLVVSDLTMPSLTGMQLAEEMLALRPDLPIILTTGFGGRLDFAQAREIGVREVMPKPFLAAGLARSVRKALTERPEVRIDG